jgi:hypothetical protein
MLPKFLRWPSRGARAVKRNAISRRSLALEHLEDRYLLSVVPSPILPDSVITTVAGSDVAGYSGNAGQATAAELNYPRGVAVNAGGNLYIADFNNNCIREVNAASGVITTVAGTTTAGYTGDGGQATAAELHDPTAVAVDARGDLYIADTVNQVIREVNVATGVITTVAGNGIAGYGGDNGPASAAELTTPTGIALDANGDLFIADVGNNRIREVNLSTHIITTVAGDGTAGFSGDAGPATGAELNSPSGIAVDTAGDLFIADFYNHRVREVSAATGLITTVAGSGTAGYSGDGGSATAADLDNPWNVAVDDCGNFYIADYGENAIREVNFTSDVITSVTGGEGAAGYAGDGGPVTAASMSAPASIALDAAGDLFVADAGNSVIREIAVGAPSFALSGPTAGTFSAGVSVTIQWTAGYVQAGHVTKISLGYDSDATAFDANQHWIEIDQISAANGAGSYTWNTTGLAGGTYYLSGYIYDFAISKAVSTSLSTPIVIRDYFALSGPTSGLYAAGQNVAIDWTAGGAAAGRTTTVSLAYATTATPAFHAQHWIEIGGVTATDGTGTYNWNTTGLAAGTYYVSGYMYDSVTKQALFSYLGTPITVANFVLSGPTYEAIATGQSITIPWMAANVVATDTTEISLAYSTSPKPAFHAEHWIEINGATAANGAGSYTWNTAGVAAGTYYLSGYMYDFAKKQAIFSYPDTPITVGNFAIANPSLGTFIAGQSVTIQWAADVVAGHVTKISLGYDTDTTAFDANEHWIEVDQITAANGTGPYTWSTAGLTAGTYYLSGYMYDVTTGKALYCELSAPITVVDFGLINPSAQTVAAGQSVTVQWTATNVDLAGPTKISLGYDPDTTAFDANQQWIEINQVVAGSGAGSYTWNTTGLTGGTYYLSGYMYDFSTDQAVFSSVSTPIVVTPV